MGKHKGLVVGGRGGARNIWETKTPQKIYIYTYNMYNIKRTAITGYKCTGADNSLRIPKEGERS